MPCVSIIRVADPAPEIRTREAYGASFLMKIDVDVQCKKHENSTEFSQVFTLQSAPINITTTMEITKDFKLTFDVAPVDIKFEDVVDSNVGEVKVGMLNYISEAMSKIINQTIDVVGKHGFPLQWIFDLLHLKFIDAHDTMIETKHDGYFKMCTNPWFNFTK